MTGPRETEWSERFRASMPAQPEGPCPSPETLWRAARGELPGHELESLATHLRTCSACGEALAVSAELAAESETRGHGWIPRKLGRVGAVAGGITALAAGLLVFLTTREPVPRDGPGPDLAVSRGAGSTALEIRPLSKEEQPASDAHLEWTPVAGAVRYRVQVSTEDLRSVHDRTLEGTVLALPPGLADPGTKLLWQVEASLPDGRTVTSSTFRVRLVPSSPTR
jgi:hypothetical protein